jgi:hypothetical protein
MDVEDDFSWGFWAGPPFRVAVGSTWTAAYVTAPVLHKHGVLTADQLAAIQRRVVCHLANGGRSAYVEKWLWLHGESDKILVRLKDTPRYQLLNRELMEDLYEAFDDFFCKASREARETAAATVEQFEYRKNFFSYQVGEESTDEIVSSIRLDMARYLPDRYKLFKEAQIFGSNVTNIWAKDNPEWGWRLHQPAEETEKFFAQFDRLTADSDSDSD